MEEIWKDVPLSNYSVSNFGRVRSNNYHREKRTVILKINTNHRYPKLSMCIDGKKFNKDVHRMVAELFVEGKSEVRNHVNHKDKNKLNNHYTNLEWTSTAENNTHKCKGLKKNGTLTGARLSSTKNKDRWAAVATLKGKRVNIGSYGSEEQAHEAYLNFLKDNNITNKYATTK